MIRSIIVDDEERSTKLLETLIHDFCTGVTVVGKAQNIQEAIELIDAHDPDLLFLDVELKENLVFKLFNEIGKFTFDIIFITAHEEYALKAFKYSATDYLLKPVDIEELKQAIQKVKVRRSSLEEIPESDISLLINSFKVTSEHTRQIALANSEGLHMVRANEIIYLKSDGPYTKFYLNSGDQIITSIHLKEYESQLPASLFFRPHNSYIVNMNEVRKFLKKDGGLLLMSNKDYVYVAKRRKQDLLKLLNPSIEIDF